LLPELHGGGTPEEEDDRPLDEDVVLDEDGPLDDDGPLDEDGPPGGTQLPAMHVKFGAHWLVEVHDVRHWVASRHVKKPGHGIELMVAQVPAPSQAPVVSINPLHPPHGVPLGSTQAPVVSHPVAAQTPPAGHMLEQQLPDPLTPQTLLVHWSFAEHGAPGEPFTTQMPLGPGFWQWSEEPMQSLSELQDDLHVVPSRQMRSPGHGMPLDPQAPEPSQIMPMICPMEHVAAPHAVPAGRCSHIPPAPHLPSFPQGLLVAEH
jgi:hypothetical protein